MNDKSWQHIYLTDGSWPIVYGAQHSSGWRVASPGGALGQVSYGGVQLRGPNPYPILGKAGLRKHTPF